MCLDKIELFGFACLEIYLIFQESWCCPRPRHPCPAFPGALRAPSPAPGVTGELTISNGLSPVSNCFLFPGRGLVTPVILFLLALEARVRGSGRSGCTGNTAFWLADALNAGPWLADADNANLWFVHRRGLHSLTHFDYEELGARPASQNTASAMTIAGIITNSEINKPRSKNNQVQLQL